MNKEKYREFLETFIPSPEMRGYLSGRELWVDGEKMAEIIKGSPVPLDTKAEWLEGEEKKKTEEALRELHTSRPGELYCFFEAWYDHDVYYEKKIFDSPVSSYEKAAGLIRSKIGEGLDENGEPDPDVFDWYLLEKWRVDENGDHVCTYTWYFIGEEPVFFHKKGDKENPHIFIDLNLPVPFEPGDILTVDCAPFAPPINALLVEKGDNGDCCCLQILYRDVLTRNWKTCALKHGIWLNSLEGPDYVPMLSPLYRLSRYKGDLPPVDSFLGRLGELIGGDEGKGRALWNMLHGYDVEGEDTDPEVKKFISSVVDEAILETYCPD